MTKGGGPGGAASSQKTGETPVKTVLVFLIFLEITAGFNQGYYTPILPKFAAYLGVSGEAMNWFQTSQAMAAAVVVPLFSRLGDLYGHRRWLRYAVLLVFIGTLAVAVVPSFPVVLAARALVGPLGVWLPLAIAIVYARAAGESARKYVSMLSAALMGGVVLGTVAAGVVSDLTTSMPVILLVPAVMVLVAAYGVYVKIPESDPGAEARIDWLGFAGLAVTMVLFIIALAYVGPTHAVRAAVLFAASFAVLLGWIWWEKRTTDPAVDLHVITSPAAWPLYVTGFLLGVVIIDAPVNLSDFLSRDPAVFGFGFNAGSGTLAGIIATMLLFATAGAVAGSYVAAQLGLRKTLVSGALLAAFGQAILLVGSGMMLLFWVSGVLTGFGLGVLVGTVPALVAEAAPRDKTGIATGLYNSLLALGGAVGGAVFKQLLVAFRDENRHATLMGYIAIWALSTLLFVAAAYLMGRVQLPDGKKSGNEAGTAAGAAGKDLTH